MKIWLPLALVATFGLNDFAQANQADDTTITIAANNPGSTPFINQLTLVASDPTVLKDIQFSIKPRTGSVTRPLSGTYSTDYLTDRGYILPGSTNVYLPVYGLYAGYTNTVTLTYSFTDGSSKTDSATITTPVYDDPCQSGQPTVLQARTKSTALSYDFIFVQERCSGSSPTVIDSDSTVRWVGPATIYDITSTLFDNAFYVANGRGLNRIDLDGTVTFLHDYVDIGVTYLHHNIDRGKAGLILDADTPAYFESTNIEVDSAGNVLKVWDLAEIISNAMVAGGDDPSQFVFLSPKDWFHNNSVVYNRADDSIIISSREDFVICLDYETGTIKWILGDPTKAWYQFPSLRQYALDLSEGTNPPIGQHAVSLSYDQNLLLFDNGFASWAHTPKGSGRGYSTPRKYRLDLSQNTATEISTYSMGNSVFSALCSSVYEDAPFNFLIDYAYIYTAATGEYHAQLLGVDSSGETVFYYQYPNALSTCKQAYNSVPLHLENTKFPAVGPKALNISTRGLVSSDDKTLIAGVIVTGSDEKRVAFRVLGPSLAGAGVADPVSDPQLSLYDSSGVLVTTNDDWNLDLSAGELSALGLAPDDSSEAATIQTLAPGSYTVVARGKGSDAGTGLLEAYDISASANSRLANISTRGFVGSADSALITGFIVGDVDNATLLIRAVGPSLSNSVEGPLPDPTLTIYDSNGTPLSSNDDWQDDPNFLDIEKQGLDPTDELEAATIIHPGPGAYTVVVSPGQGGDGIGLAEVYDLD